MTLGGLILLDIVDQHLQAAIHTAMVEIEAKPANLYRLPAALVLSRINTGVEDVEDLVVAREQRPIKYLEVAAVPIRLPRRRCLYHESCIQLWDLGHAFAGCGVLCRKSKECQ